MNSTHKQLITAEEFWLLPGDCRRRDLVRGKVVPIPIQGMQHGRLLVSIGCLLINWATSTRLGIVAVRAGFILSRNPDTVRGIDVVCVQTKHIPPGGIPEGYGDFPPDLAVEVISASESGTEVREKIRDYLAAGTPLVWTVYPNTREVIVHTPDGFARTFGENESLEFPEVLPGFRCVVREFFE